ncbi:mannose-P-dolichol utilization defect 1 protein [Roridomyces roridus]|uniref:Mannose-P-dolichol utilization defect 1 protein homolog n=1 Tax=Roridomyces roridus TaxID=1738132 RepID=A0AAD7CG13_9AGAR|nr:mannose-P-dolichol utilization defect 1 protein [Roridomyces roridus]
MTSITRNLPWFIRDLGVSIVGQECYTSLIENLDLSDVKCIKYSISKGLGIGIVVGGSIVKVPQLLSILNAKSARGLSLPAYILETFSYSITLVYAYRNATTNASGGLLRCLALLFTLNFISLPSLAYTQLATLPLSLFSKLPQIRENYTAQSTGQLSAFAVVAQILGCAARLFTTATEVNDPVVAAGFQLALVLNLVLGVQLWMYAPSGAAAAKKEKEKKEEKAAAVPLVAPVPVAASVPATPPIGGGRKWARKVD